MTTEAQLPQGWLGLVQKLIDDAIAKFARSGFLQNASISGGAGLTIKDGGILRLETADGTAVFYVGPVDPPLSDGSPQPGMIVRRNNGTIALHLYDPIPAVGDYNQFLAWRDRVGSAIITDDTDSGLGIARPHLGHAFYPSRVSDFPKSTAAAFETVFRAKVEKQQPKLYVEAWGATDTAGTTGQVQVTVDDVVWGAAQAASSGVVTGYAWGPAAVSGNFGETLRVEIQARRTAGTGSVQVGAGWVTGWQS